MGKPTVPIPHKAKLRKGKSKSKSGSRGQKTMSSVPELLEEAAVYLQISRPEDALDRAQKAYALLNPSAPSISTSSTAVEPSTTTPLPPHECLPAISLLGDIYVELGEMDLAKRHFLLAVALDPDGSSTLPGGGAEKFLWMAQLCENGGSESIEWFNKGAAVLRAQLAELEDRRRSMNDDTAGDDASELDEEVEEKKQKLGSALCGIAEVYMTDLSFDDAEAESQCENAITEAATLCPTSPDVLQTLASIRISQHRIDEARTALSTSVRSWIDLPPDAADDAVPAFPTRIALVRMLVEVSLLDDATAVAEGLVLDDDSSVEAAYLGGWSYWLAYADAKAAAATAAGSEQQQQQQQQPSGTKRDDDELESLVRRSRWFLQRCLKLYQKIGYEDEPLREHAVEIWGLVKAELEVITGRVVDDEEEEEDAWEVDSDDDDDGGDGDMMDTS